jgi:hypothetical protein
MEHTEKVNSVENMPTDTVKILVWPLTLLIALFMFKGPIENFLASLSSVISNPAQESTFEISKDRFIFSKRAKDETEQIATELKQLQQQVSKENINKQKLFQKLEQLEFKANSVVKNIDQDQAVLAAVSERALQKTRRSEVLPSTNKATELAFSYEQDGFKALLNKDLSLALHNFSQAENTKPGYHSTFEIKNFLTEKTREITSNPSLVQTEKFWQHVYEEIVKKYSWGMPSSIKTELKSRIVRAH